MLVAECRPKRFPHAINQAAILVLAAFTLSVGAASESTTAPDDRVVAVAASGTGYRTVIKAHAGKVALSRNGGRDWLIVPLPEVTGPVSVSTVAISPRRQGTFYVAGPGFGVLRSTDGGNTWVTRNSGLPSLDVATLALHADQAETVYAYIRGKGIFRSEDGGERWKFMDAGPRNAIAQLIHTNMPESMQTGWLFGATERGVGRSMDCFCGWRDAGGLGQNVSKVTFDPGEPQRVYAATAQGLFTSADGGEHWSPVKTPDQVSALVGTRSGLLIATGATGDLYGSDDHGTTWHRVGT